MRILVTGASGFVGSHFVRAALGKSNMRIFGVVRPSTLLDPSVFENANFSTVLSDSASLRELFESTSIDMVLHLATEYGRGDTALSKVLEANLALPISILDLCREFGTPVFVNMDSYFNKADFTYSHLSNYALSKKSLANWFPYYSESTTIVNVILEHVYGLGDSSKKFVPQMINDIAMENVARVPATDGFQRRDFIHVDDVVSALFFLLENERNSLDSPPSIKAVPLGTGQTHSIRQLCELIREISNSTSVVGFGDLPMRSDEIAESFADIGYLRSLGWNPRYELEPGLRAVILNWKALV